MPNNRRATTSILSAVVILVVAIILFFSGNGHLSARLSAAFVLLAGLALALLIAATKATRSKEASVSVEARLRERAAKKKAEPREAGVPNPEPARKGAAADIISDTAGELRTSVDVIQDELEEILDDEVHADSEHMQTLYQETDRLKKIIDGMEQLSRAQAIARALRKEPVPIEPLLRAVIEKTRANVQNSDITFNLECEQGLAAKGDADCLEIIIANIADNAARSIKGAGSVILTATRNGEAVVFSIQDTGTGIRRAHLSHLYERFFRGAGSGIGMGLSIVKELVDACGGKLEVQTEAGKGTTFTVQLPG
jgi:signal transduction histidine kinase